MRAASEIENDVTSYIEGVLAKEIVVGRLVRLAVERHVRDLEHGSKRRLRFNRDRARRSVWWMENRLKFSKGEWAGKPFRLQPWQAFIVWSLFGWERYVDDRWIRRFRTGYISVARKNGKTELVAAIGLLILVGYVAEGRTWEAEPGGEIYAAATKRDQAKLCWEAAARMVKKSPLLRKEIGVHDSRQNLTHYGNESRFETVASDSDTLDGLSPLLGVIDEYHAHPTSDVFDVIESGMGARREPLMLVPTTAGERREGPCWDIESDAVKVLERIGEEEGLGDDLFAFVARLDEGDEWSLESAWIKANPNLGVSVHMEKLRVGAKVAKRRANALNEFLRKHMNLWTEVSTAWLPMPAWDACADAVDIEALRGQRCYVGIDLSAVSDYTAAVAVFPPSGERTTWDVLPAFWIPAETLMERKQTDRVPVNQWVEADLVEATPGDVVDQDAVKNWLINLRERYDVAALPMDPHNATKLQTELQSLGFTVISMRQGWVTMSPAIKETEKLIRQKKVRHGGHPVLRWMLSNVALKRDSSDNLSLHKGRSADRIDGIVGLVMGIGYGVAQPAPVVQDWKVDWAG